MVNTGQYCIGGPFEEQGNTTSPAMGLLFLDFPHSVEHLMDTACCRKPLSLFCWKFDIIQEVLNNFLIEVRLDSISS